LGVNTNAEALADFRLRQSRYPDETDRSIAGAFESLSWFLSSACNLR
jgi:hypothetical protein